MTHLPGEQGMSVPEPKQAWRKRLFRRLGWLYLAALHILLAVLLLDPGVVQRARRSWDHDSSVTAEYEGMVLGQMAVCDGMPERAVVFLGDSRLRRLLVHETVTPADVPVVNLSIGGDTTKGLLGRSARYAHLQRASRLIVGTGVNDLSHFRDDVVLDYYRKILTFVTGIGPKVTVVSIYPINEKIYAQANITLVTGLKVTNARILEINARIRELCGELGHIDYLDVNASVTGEDGNLRPAFSDDGLHLNDTGNKAWGAALRSALSGA